MCVLSLCRLIAGEGVMKKSQATLIAAGVAMCHCRVRLRREKVRTSDDLLLL